TEGPRRMSGPRQYAVSRPDGYDGCSWFMGSAPSQVEDLVRRAPAGTTPGGRRPAQSTRPEAHPAVLRAPATRRLGSLRPARRDLVEAGGERGDDLVQWAQV